MSQDKQLACTKAASEYQKAWFSKLRKDVFENQKPYAIVQADMPMELFYLMDMPVVSNQWWAAIISAKKLAPYYLDKRTELGFHKNLCSYCSLGLACTLDNNPERAPWGGLPKPAIMSARLTCDCIQKVFEIWAKKFDTLFFPLDSTAATHLPPRWWEMSRHNWENLFQPHRLDFMVAQQERLVIELEKITGKKFDINALRLRMEQVNVQEEYLEEVREMICTAPKTPVRMAEQISNVMTAQWHRGSEWAVNHAKAFRDEVKTRVENGIAAYPDEKLRLMWVGAGLWHDTDFYTAFEEEYGAVFVWSMYLAFGPDGYIRYGLDDPMRALASRVVSMNEQLHNPPWANEWIADQAKKHRIDAAFVLIPKGSRPSATGSYFIKNALEALGIPTMEIWTDMVDGRDWDGVEMRKKAGDFLLRAAKHGGSKQETVTPEHAKHETIKYETTKHGGSTTFVNQQKGIPIGYTSVNIPTELIEAANGSPILLHGGFTNTMTSQHGDSTMEPTFDKRTRFLYSSILNGDWSFLKLLIISRTSEAEHKLYLYLKEAIRQGFGEKIPPIYLFDILQTPSELSKSYSLERTLELKAEIERVTSEKITDANLTKAILKSNEVRKALRKIYTLRRFDNLKITGTEAMTILSASRYMDKNCFIEHAKKLYKTFSRRKPSMKLRVMIKGYPVEDLNLHQKLENKKRDEGLVMGYEKRDSSLITHPSSCIVISEDSIFGNPNIEADIALTGDLLSNIFEKYYTDAQNPRAFPMSIVKERFEKEIKNGVQSVVFNFPDDDDLYGWHYPEQKDFLMINGINH